MMPASLDAHAQHCCWRDSHILARISIDLSQGLHDHLRCLHRLDRTVLRVGYGRERACVILLVAEIGSESSTTTVVPVGLKIAFTRQKRQNRMRMRSSWTDGRRYNAVFAQAMSSETGSFPVCTVCQVNFEDARLVPCLHSVCRVCVDRQPVYAKKSGPKIRCPKCQEWCKPPEDRGVVLPNDTFPTGRCVLCDDEATSSEVSPAATAPPSRVCSTCSVVLCDKHVRVHLDAHPDHTIGNLSNVSWPKA